MSKEGRQEGGKPKLWPDPSPVTMAMMRACETMPTSRLASTIPIGELRQFCDAFLAAYGVKPPTPPSVRRTT